MTEQWYAEGLLYMKAEEDPGTGKAMLDAAAQYMIKLGVPAEKIGEDPVLDLTIKSLALHWFDHRDSVGDESAFPNGIRPLITMYKIAYGQ